MTAVRKIVNSCDLVKLFDLPPAFKNRKIEVLMFPVEEQADNSAKKSIPALTMAQVEEWAKAPEIQALVGVLKKTGLPANISISDIRNERLTEKYIK